MNWMGTTRERVAVCAGCHVGAPADPQAGIPVREVTHDLIAAGHPRLQFDTTTYLAALPPHWIERDRERDGTNHTATTPGPQHELRTWFEGERETVQARLRLLQDQASRTATWPELATFDCYACHHELAPDRSAEWRRNRAVANRKLGVVLADPVGDPLRRWLASSVGFPEADQQFQAATRLGVNPEQTLAAARALQESLARSTPPADLQALLARWSSAKNPALPLLWDDAARYYYALRALQPQVAQDRQPTAALGRTTAWERSLEAFAQALRFPREPLPINSPKDYDPTRAHAALQTTLAEFQKWLTAEPQPAIRPSAARR
jgi:hypothetical protein